MRLEGKVAIVTGAGSGIGRGIAKGYAREGAAIVVNDILRDTAEETADSIRAAGGRAVAVCADVADLAQHHRLIGAAVARFQIQDFRFKRMRRTYCNLLRRWGEARGRQGSTLRGGAAIQNSKFKISDSRDFGFKRTLPAQVIVFSG